MDCSMDCFMDCLMDLIIMILHKIATCEHSFDNITIVIFQYQRNFSEWKWTAYVMDCFMDCPMDCFMDYMMDCYGLCCGLTSHYFEGGYPRRKQSIWMDCSPLMDCSMDCYGLASGLLWTMWWTTMD